MTKYKDLTKEQKESVCMLIAISALDRNFDEVDCVLDRMLSDVIIEYPDPFTIDPKIKCDLEKSSMSIQEIQEIFHDNMAELPIRVCGWWIPDMLQDQSSIRSLVCKMSSSLIFDIGIDGVEGLSSIPYDEIRSVVSKLYYIFNL